MPPSPSKLLTSKRVATSADRLLRRALASRSTDTLSPFREGTLVGMRDYRLKSAAQKQLSCPPPTRFRDPRYQTTRLAKRRAQSNRSDDLPLTRRHCLRGNTHRKGCSRESWDR